MPKATYKCDVAKANISYRNTGYDIKGKVMKILYKLSTDKLSTLSKITLGTILSGVGNYQLKRGGKEVYEKALSDNIDELFDAWYDSKFSHIERPCVIEVDGTYTFLPMNKVEIGSDTKVVELSVPEIHCDECGVLKQITEFKPESRNKTGHTAKCTSCIKKAALANSRTENSVIAAMYSSNKRAVVVDECKVNYTKEEFSDWLYNNGFKELYDEWVISGYVTHKRPKAQLVKLDGPYHLDNLLLTTSKESADREYAFRAKGGRKLKLGAKPVYEYLDGEFVKKYQSYRAAKDACGFNMHRRLRKSMYSKHGRDWSYLKPGETPVENMVTCTDCGETKPSSEFASVTRCKVCEKERLEIKSRTEIGCLRRIYSDQRGSSTKRGHQAPPYTFEELRDFAYDNGYKVRYDAWVESGYLTDERPSFDRLDSSKPYSFDNMELVKWKINKERQYSDNRKNVGSNPQGTRIYKFKDGVLTNECISYAECKRQMGYGMHKNLETGRPCRNGYYYSYENKWDDTRFKKAYHNTPKKFNQYKGDEIIKTFDSQNQARAELGYDIYYPLAKGVADRNGYTYKYI